MRRSALLLLVVLSPTIAQAQHFTSPDRIATIPAPVPMDTTGLFRAAADRVGDDVFVAGQPTERGLREMKALGVTTVVNLRTPEEMSRVGFDEAALASQLGMKYVYLPVRGDATFPYSPETVAKFARALQSADGRVLLHCTVAWRASHLWAAYLIQERGVPVEDALANARAINLMDTHRMSSGSMQLVEEFLGRTLPTLGKPPKGR
jgi:uncharacterized protein (TIGR01244 family)